MRYQDRERVRRVTKEAAKAENRGLYLWAREQWSIARHIWSKLGDKTQEKYCDVRSKRCSIMAIDTDEAEDEC